MGFIFIYFFQSEDYLPFEIEAEEVELFSLVF